MYYLLKQNTFFLETGNNGLFMKNNYGDLRIGTPKSYSLFIAFLPYLDGRSNIENDIFPKIKNEKLKNFYEKFLKTLTEQKFVLFSKQQIDISDYNDFAKSAMFYCNNLDELKNITNKQNLSIKVSSKNQEVNKAFSEIFDNKIDSATVEFNNVNYITISILPCNDHIINIYLYKEQNADTIIISTNIPDASKLDDNFLNLPLHIFEIIARILEIEINLKIYNIQNTTFFENDSIFDLRLLSIKQKNQADE